jgi:hypothetical protein
MATILVKGIPEEVLKELKRLKVELNCKTWADLFGRLVELREPLVLSNDDVKKMDGGVQNFLRLGVVVSKNWSGAPSVMGEFRKSRRHASR